jgi:hypothetical protein
MLAEIIRIVHPIAAPADNSHTLVGLRNSKKIIAEHTKVTTEVITLILPLQHNRINIKIINAKTCRILIPVVSNL